MNFVSVMGHLEYYFRFAFEKGCNGGYTLNQSQFGNLILLLIDNMYCLLVAHFVMVSSHLRRHTTSGYPSKFISTKLLNKSISINCFH